MEKIAIYLTNLCVKEGIISEDYDIYYYGFMKQLGFAISSILILIFGLLTNQPIESIIFLSVFGTIREYSGGYHADTQFKCTILSILTFLTSLILKWILGSYIVYVSGISMFVIIRLAPVPNDNKPNTPNLLLMAKHKTKVVTLFFYLIAVIGKVLSISHLEIIHSIMIEILFLMIIQIKKTRRIKNEI